MCNARPKSRWQKNKHKNKKQITDLRCSVWEGGVGWVGLAFACHVQTPRCYEMLSFKYMHFVHHKVLVQTRKHPPISVLFHFAWVLTLKPHPTKRCLSEFFLFFYFLFFFICCDRRSFIRTRFYSTAGFTFRETYSGIQCAISIAFTITKRTKNEANENEPNERESHVKKTANRRFGCCGSTQNAQPLIQQATKTTQLNHLRIAQPTHTHTHIYTRLPFCEEAEQGGASSRLFLSFYFIIFFFSY